MLSREMYVCEISRLLQKRMACIIAKVTSQAFDELYYLFYKQI